jgi:preprotein translocase subunit SecD
MITHLKLLVSVFVLLTGFIIAPNSMANDSVLFVYEFNNDKLDINTDDFVKIESYEQKDGSCTLLVQLNDYAVQKLSIFSSRAIGEKMRIYYKDKLLSENVVEYPLNQAKGIFSSLTLNQCNEIDKAWHVSQNN